MTVSWPTTRLAISCAMRTRARARSSISSASPTCAGAAPFTAASTSLMMLLYRGSAGSQSVSLELALLQRFVLQRPGHLEVDSVQIGIEGIGGDPVVERDLRLVESSALEERLRVERLGGLVL